ncbi:MAG: hypothetical protein J5950_04250 [Clostridia bacterium]|nr:hypothetical protein [Clostridia bacterium]
MGAKDKTKKKKKKYFWKILLIIVLVFMIAILVGLIWFFNWLSDYEESERHHVAERVVSMCEQGEYEYIASLTDVVSAGLESKEVYAEEIGKLMAGKEISYTKAFSYDRFEKPAYKILADGEYVCKLTLRKSGKSKYNFDTYEPESFSAFDFGYGSAAFLVPDFYEVYCNGKLLDDKFIVKSGLNPELMKYALTDRENPSLSRYEITGLTSRCEIVAIDSSGMTVELEEKNGIYEASFVSMRFSVPDNISVYVNGVKMEGKYLYEDSGESAPASTGAYAPMLMEGAVVSGFTSYRVDYISPLSVYKALNERGEEVELRLGSDGVYKTGVTEYTVKVPEGWTVKAGDTQLSGTDRWFVSGGEEVEELKTILTKYLPERPVFCEYRFSVLDSDPAPEVKLLNAVGTWQTLKLGEGNVYSYDFRLEEDVTELTALAIKRTKSYAEYITNDMEHDKFMRLILEDQPMYSELVDNPYYFYTGHKKHWFENESWTDLRVYSDSCFSCEVSFDYYIGQIKTDADFVKMLPLDVRFWYVKYEGSWYMAEWEISS